MLVLTLFFFRSVRFTSLSVWLFSAVCLFRVQRFDHFIPMWPPVGHGKLPTLKRPQNTSPLHFSKMQINVLAAFSTDHLRNTNEIKMTKGFYPDAMQYSCIGEHLKTLFSMLNRIDRNRYDVQSRTFGFMVGDPFRHITTQLPLTQEFNSAYQTDLSASIRTY